MQINAETKNSAQTGLAFELEIDVIISDQRWLEKMDEADLNKLIRKAVLNAIEIANPAISGPGEISIVLSNDAH
ncbi:hypothetical protein MNBD_ALPHA11-140, partial [hydrothermal vent metagenome]